MTETWSDGQEKDGIKGGRARERGPVRDFLQRRDPGKRQSSSYRVSLPFPFTAPSSSLALRQVSDQRAIFLFVLLFLLPFVLYVLFLNNYRLPRTCTNSAKPSLAFPSFPQRYPCNIMTRRWTLYELLTRLQVSFRFHQVLRACVCVCMCVWFCSVLAHVYILVPTTLNPGTEPGQHPRVNLPL